MPNGTVQHYSQNHLRNHAHMAFVLAVSAFASSPSQAQSQLAPPAIVTSTSTGVNLADGSFTTSNDDLTMGTLRLTRSYISGYEMSNHYFSANWTHNFDIWLRQNYYSGQYTVDLVVGREAFSFSGTFDSNYPNSDSIGTNLSVVGGVPTFTNRDGTVYRFGPGTYYRKVSSITRPDGSVETIIYSSDQPKLITSTRGYSIVFDYSSGNVSTACAYNLATTYVSASTTCSSATYKVSYGYTSSHLSSFQDALGITTGYTYTYGMVSCITIPGTSTCKVSNIYTGNPHGLPTNYNTLDVTQQTLADGSVWHYSCSCGSGLTADPDDPAPQDYNTVTEPNGATYSWVFLNGNQPYVKTDENGVQTFYTFVGSRPWSVQLPEGNQVSWHYSSRLADAGNTFTAKAGSGLAAINTGTRTYPSTCSNYLTCNQPTTSADANGNSTSYTYDSTHGGTLTETLPAVAGINPVVRHTYAQRYASIKDSSGNYVHATSPVWVRTETRTCRMTATVSGACSSANDEVITSYDYGPDTGAVGNNLLVRGVAITAFDPSVAPSGAMVTLRTCYSYDANGNRTSETTPRGTTSLTVCP